MLKILKRIFWSKDWTLFQIFYTSIYFSTNLFCFFLMGNEPSFQSNSKPTSAVCYTCDSVLLNCLDAISPYLCNDPEHCFSVALTDYTWTGPWKAALTSHPWANQKVVQNALLLQSCHLRGRVLRNKMGLCLDMTMTVTPPPAGHGRWHWKGRKDTKAGAVGLWEQL